MSLKTDCHAILNKALSEYKSIFRAGVVLAGLAFAGLLQIFSIATELGSEARKLQYQLEERHGMQNILEIDCMAVKSGLAECKYAQYKYQENESAMKMAAIVIVIFFYCGVFLIVLSAVGFCKSATSKKLGSA